MTDDALKKLSFMLTGTDLKIYLCARFHLQSGERLPDNDSFGKMIGLNRSSVCRALGILMHAGIIDKTGPHNDARYKLTDPEKWVSMEKYNSIRNARTL